MRKTPLRPILLLVMLSLALPAGVAADLPVRVMTNTGSIASLSVGLEIDHEDAAARSLAFLLLEPDGRRISHALSVADGVVAVGRGLVFLEEHGLYVAVWEEVVSDRATRLLVAIHDGDRWLRTIDVAEGLGKIRGSAEIAVTRGQRLSMKDRQVALSPELHFAWRDEESGEDYYGVLPLDGTAQRVLHVRLSGLLARIEDRREGVEASTVGWSMPPFLRASADGESVLLGVIDSLRQRLTSLKIEPIAPELLRLADDARAQITWVGATVPSLEELAKRLLEYVEERGQFLHPGVLDFLAGRLERLVLEEGEVLDPAVLSRLGEKARAQITWVGLRVEDGGLASKEPAWILDTSDSQDRNQRGSLLSLRLDSPLPEDLRSPQSIFLSADGRRALLAEVGREGVGVTVVGPEGWSERQSLGQIRYDASTRSLLQNRVDWAIGQASE